VKVVGGIIQVETIASMKQSKKPFATKDGLLRVVDETRFAVVDFPRAVARRILALEAAAT
jgi:hypothetical protein